MTTPRPGNAFDLGLDGTAIVGRGWTHVESHHRGVRDRDERGDHSTVELASQPEIAAGRVVEGLGGADVALDQCREPLVARLGRDPV
jgi:hypothetical protein